MDDALNQLRSELAGRYEVEQELGHGGMAVVYLAKDLRHERKVAIKVLRQDVGGATAERFLREIRTVAALHHSHILQLLDSGTAGEHLFYVMPYVEGETIRQRLEREGPLPVDEAVRIAREVADALAFAHARGIVHRDIKPENVFLSAGHALVADFGIARAAESAAGSTTLTDAGLAVGTPSYMSPEQATAEPKIDGRSDQYALGCVLYEMLAGAPPFTGPTSQAIMARHTADPVPPLRTVRDVPPALERAINRALAKMPADRWPTISTFRESLEPVQSESRTPPWARGSTAVRWRWAALGASGALVVALGVASSDVLRSSRPSAVTSDSIRLLAVRPFSFQGDSTGAIYAQGLADELLPGLVRVGWLRVRGPDRVALLGDSTDDNVAIGQRLRVDAVLSGEVHHRGGKLRVIPQLTRVSDGVILWTDNYYAEPGDVFSIQDSMAVHIVAALTPYLAPERRNLAARGMRTRDPEALRLYLEGRRARLSMTKDGIENALSLLNQAIARDSTYSDAWAALTLTLDNYLGFSTQSPTEMNAAMRRASNRAIELDSLNGFAYSGRGWNKALFDWDWDGAWRDLRQAVRLSPGSVDVMSDYAAFLGIVNERDSAVVYATRALDPTNWISYHQLGSALAQAGLRDSAIAVTRQALLIEPNAWQADYNLAHWYLEDGRRMEADSLMRRFLRFGGDLAQALGYASIYFRRAGDRAGAQEMLDRLLVIQRERSFGTHTSMSMVRLALGDRGTALDELEAAARDYETLLPLALIHGLTPLRGEPRFEAVRRRVFGDRQLPSSQFD